MTSSEHEHTSPRSGESRPFHFESTWHVPTTRERAWSALTDVESWPGWWPGMRSVTLTPAEGGVGSRAAVVAGSPAGPVLRFGVRLTGMDEPRVLRFEADGDLRGTGAWSLHEEAAGTRMEILWCVVSRRPAIRASRPLAGWAHARLMWRGGRGLRRHLGP